MATDENPLNRDRMGATETETPLPFAGRDDALALMNHYLSDPTHSEVVTYIGRRRIGKTTLLRQFARISKTTVLAAYLPLRDLVFRDEGNWLHLLSQAIRAAVSSEGYNLAETEPLTNNIASVREWFSEQYLPAAQQAIRHRQRLVLLIDDLDKFLDASGTPIVSPDCFAYLHSLHNPNLGIAATVDLAFENELQHFAPLVHKDSVFRLSRFAPEATKMLLRNSTKGTKSVPDDAVDIVHKETGGDPVLVQHFASALSEKEVISRNSAKDTIAEVYTRGSADLNLLWNLLSPVERHVAIAISNLKYHDPIRPVDTNAIERWLARTNHPTDSTSINRALRSMEFYDIAQGSTSDVSLCAGLMHKWVLENAEAGAEEAGLPPENRLRMLVGLIMVAIVLLVILAKISSSTRQESMATSVPTAPLSNPE